MGGTLLLVHLGTRQVITRHYLITRTQKDLFSCGSFSRYDPSTTNIVSGKLTDKIRAGNLIYPKQSYHLMKLNGDNFTSISNWATLTWGSNKCIGWRGTPDSFSKMGSFTFECPETSIHSDTFCQTTIQF